MDRSSIGERMKSYEDSQKTYLIRRMPVMIRLDGNAFHTFTRGFERPFDSIMTEAMQRTMKYLCENISGCVLGYTQSDEITLLLIDYKQINQQPYFGYVKRKVESISASMATMAFNNSFCEVINEKVGEEAMNAKSEEDVEKIMYRYKKYMSKAGYAMFDSRAFNIPEFEVVNEFIWRQQDCVRNSIQSVGHANFSETKMYGKNMSQIQDMLMEEKGINWNDFPVYLKRGSCCIKVPVVFNEGKENEFTRNKWIVDKDIPTFTKDKGYIEQRFLFHK